MKRLLVILAVLSMSVAAWAAPAERYLHVRVDDATSGQKVRINIPLSLAVQVIPAIDNGRLRDGKIEFGHFEANGVNVKQILDALKTAPDGEFVTVEAPDQNIRVAKRNGMLIVRVRDIRGEKQNVDVTVPWAVAEALAANTTQNQLNLEAAIQALQKAGDMTLVTVTGDKEHVRVWIDSNSTAAE